MWVLKAIEIVVEYGIEKPMEAMGNFCDSLEISKEKTSKELMEDLLDQVKELNEKIDKENR